MAEIKSYPDLPRTSFPQKEDTFPLMTDVDATLLPIVHQYEEYARAGNIQACNQLLTAYPALKSCLWTCEHTNQLRDGLIAVERYYLEDVHSMVEQIAQNTIGINDHPTPEQEGVTAYSARQTNAIVENVTRVITLTLPANGWSSTAPYTQTISSEQIKGTDNPIVSLHIPSGSTDSSMAGSTGETVGNSAGNAISAAAEDVKAWNKAFSMIDEGITEDGQITFVCYNKKPTVNITVAIKGV